MRTIVPILAAAVLAAVAIPAAAETKIAVISTQVLLRDAPQVRAADAALKAEFQKREDELKVEDKRLADDIQKFRREADTMSPEQRTSAQNDLATRKTKLEVKQRQYNEQAGMRNRDLERAVLDKVNQAIAEVAREKGVGIVVRDPAFADVSFDLTQDVLKKLATYPVSVPPASAATPAEKKKKN